MLDLYMWAHRLDANAANDGHDGNALKKGCTARRRENLVQARNTVDTVLDILRLSANSAQDQRRAQLLFLARSIVSMAQLRYISVAYVRARAPVDLDTLPSLNIEFVGLCVTARRRRDGGTVEWHSGTAR
ncbi:hypothetical protein C8F04DRAFT_1278114 [Mycena alexandri]|uniref:Uncharacterized protein n=1 Tax=Mycena alexandri TaxID=1745969 RepID=A0AAD6RZ06_9AGAR|nr:hypothetical protein C8F04DRAFT_1278114 [Mycena alexandri]